LQSSAEAVRRVRAFQARLPASDGVEMVPVPAVKHLFLIDCPRATGKTLKGDRQIIRYQRPRHQRLHLRSRHPRARHRNDHLHHPRPSRLHPRPRPLPRHPRPRHRLHPGNAKPQLGGRNPSHLRLQPNPRPPPNRGWRFQRQFHLHLPPQVQPSSQRHRSRPHYHQHLRGQPRHPRLQAKQSWCHHRFQL